MYTTQSLRVKWSDTTSPQFTVMNGVKQGGVLSPILFALGMEEFYSYKEKTLEKRQSRETKYNTTKKRKYIYNYVQLYYLLFI